MDKIIKFALIPRQNVSCIYTLNPRRHFCTFSTFMDIVRIFWVINFFFFLLVLIFLWSKMYMITKKTDELFALLKQSNEVKTDEAPEKPASSKS